MIVNDTVFSYVLPSTGNIVEYRGFTPPSYSLNIFDEIDLAVAMHLGSQASFPTDWSALCINSSTGKYLIGGWPGNQTDNLNYCNANGNQFYLSNRFLQTGTAQPSNRPLPIKFRCVASNNWFGYVDVEWQVYLSTVYSNRLTNIYNATGREYRVRTSLYWAQYNSSKNVTASGSYSFYWNKDNGDQWWVAKSVSRVGGDNFARMFLETTPILQRKIDGTWTNLTPISFEGFSSPSDIDSGWIGNFSSGTGNYYGSNSTYGGSGGGSIPMSMYEA